MDVFREFVHNVQSNLLQPLLLFFYAGFLIPIFRVAFEFPHAVYQGLTIYLLLAIGWHGGEELAKLSAEVLYQALGFMLIGIVTNTLIGCLAYVALRGTTRLRRIDAATVAGYYGSDSAGTFVTCIGVLVVHSIAYAPYMPVMLAVMEIPGCLVALYIVSRLRRHGLDSDGYMPDEHPAPRPIATHPVTTQPIATHPVTTQPSHTPETTTATHSRLATTAVHAHTTGDGAFSWKILHEVFFNPGIYLLFAGITIGFISGYQGGGDKLKWFDVFFVDLFKAVLCLFLLEMGITASKRFRDLRSAGPGFIAFGLIAPNVFATLGIVIAHAYSHFLGTRFDLGTYMLFAVLCGAASYIAVPAVQRLAIPEASPTLPLAASLGLTFSYNVTIGIPVYQAIAEQIIKLWPVAS